MRCSCCAVAGGGFQNWGGCVRADCRRDERLPGNRTAQPHARHVLMQGNGRRGQGGEGYVDWLAPNTVFAPAPVPIGKRYLVIPHKHAGNHAARGRAVAWARPRSDLLYSRGCMLAVPGASVPRCGLRVGANNHPRPPPVLSRCAGLADRGTAPPPSPPPHALTHTSHIARRAGGATSTAKCWGRD